MLISLPLRRPSLMRRAQVIEILSYKQLRKILLVISQLEDPITCFRKLQQ